MPIEIKELHIRVAVSPPPAEPARAPNALVAGAADKDMIVAECVEQVLEILRAKKER